MIKFENGYPSDSARTLIASMLVVFLVTTGPKPASAQNKQPAPTVVPKVMAPPSEGSIQRSAKPAPVSASHLPAKKTTKKLYQASAQETADSILADTLGQLVHQGDAHFHEGEYNHTISLSKIVVEGDPHNVEAFSNSAWLLWSMTRNDEATDMLKAGIKANPDTYYMYDEMGNHYLLLRKDPISALPYFEKAVTFKVPTFTTWQNLGRCYEKANQWDKAVEAWRKATLYPEAKRAEYNLKRVKAERDKRKS